MKAVWKGWAMLKNIDESLAIIDDVISELLFLAANNSKVSYALQQLEVVKQLLLVKDNSEPMRAMILFLFATTFSQIKLQQAMEALKKYCPEQTQQEWDLLTSEIIKIRSNL